MLVRRVVVVVVVVVTVPGVRSIAEMLSAGVRGCAWLALRRSTESAADWLFFEHPLAAIIVTAIAIVVKARIMNGLPTWAASARPLP